MLQVSFDEPGKTTGKPSISKRFRGSSADAIIEEFDEATGAFSVTEVFLVDGQSQSKGKPKFSSLFLSTFEESFDEADGTFTFTEWFGVADLSVDQFAIDKKLTSASVLADLTLQGETCTSTVEDEELECPTSDWPRSRSMSAGKAPAISNQFKRRGPPRESASCSEARRRAALRMWRRGQRRHIDLTDALGSLTNQSTGDFIMIQAPALPEAHGA